MSEHGVHRHARHHRGSLRQVLHSTEKRSPPSNGSLRIGLAGNTGYLDFSVRRGYRSRGSRRLKASIAERREESGR
jgi:hypothetical protein